MCDEKIETVIIIGAGISGLLLARYLTEHNVPYRIYERRTNLETLNEGWGLTLHWSLPTLRDLLGESFSKRLSEAYVDKAAVERGEASAFPFFDLSTGELKFKTPLAPESQRIRVSRQKFRRLLASDINIEWGKSYVSHSSDSDSVTVRFDDGTQCIGKILVGCDGANSRVRRALHPNPDVHTNYTIPVHVMGLKTKLTPLQIKPLRDLDAFFLQATSSEHDIFMYLSVLDAPDDKNDGLYTVQIVTSWPHSNRFSFHQSALGMPTSNSERLELLICFSSICADPFRTLIEGLPDDIELRPIELSDWLPLKNAHGHENGRVVLLGDAFHPMAMYRGDGANHAIRDVHDLVHEFKIGGDTNYSKAKSSIRDMIDRYEDKVIERTRPAVLASRRAALDAHKYGKLNATSPLLGRRVMMLDYSEEL